MQPEVCFRSFFMGGFECSSHRRRDGRRLDLLAATGHDRLVREDYRQLRALGLQTVRDGLRWHRIETEPGRYDWSSFLPMLRASVDLDVQVIWDLCHYGWPDDLDIWSDAFIERFARFAGEAARIVQQESDAVPFYCPVNEMSYWAWAGGEVGRMNPCAEKQGHQLKRRLIRAAVAAIEAVRAVDPRARFVYAEPLIHVTSGTTRGRAKQNAETYRQAQFEAYDLISGRLEPELGGRPDYLDIVGANFYPDNQWYLGGRTIHFGHHAYRPFRDMLAELHQRYHRPVLITETGAEGGVRASWLHYVCGEVQAALAQKTPVLGVCFYPILDYPGWDDDRHCDVGLLTNPDSQGHRAVCQSLLDELERQQIVFETVREGLMSRHSHNAFSMAAGHE
jgi:hypothetical protein